MPKRTVAKLINLLTGESERVLQNQIDDRQALSMLDNVDAFMSSRQIFAPPDVIEVAATMKPAEIFTGATGIAKLVDWAVDDNCAAIGADPEGNIAIGNYATSNFNTLASTYAGFRERIEDYVEDHFAAVMAVPEVAAELEAYIIANVTTLGADTEIRAAFVAAGWTAPA